MVGQPRSIESWRNVDKMPDKCPKIVSKLLEAPAKIKYWHFWDFFASLFSVSFWRSGNPVQRMPVATIARSLLLRKNPSPKPLPRTFSEPSLQVCVCVCVLSYDLLGVHPTMPVTGASSGRQPSNNNLCRTPVGNGARWTRHLLKKWPFEVEYLEPNCQRMMLGFSLGSGTTTQSSLKGFRRGAFERQTCLCLRRFSLIKVLNLRGEMLLANTNFWKEKGPY